MNFDFPDECKTMAGEVRRVLDKRCTMGEVRHCLAQGRTSAVAWQALAELGVLGAAVPERWGGSGLTVLELAACAEEIGRSCAPVPTLACTYLATEALLAHGTEAQRARWLPEFAAGRAVGTVAWQAPKLRVHQGRASGVIEALPAGADASCLIAIDDAGAAWCIPLAHSGVTRQGLRVLDPGYPLATITLDGAPAEAMDAPAGAAALWLDRAAVLLAFEQLGGAERALAMARSYALQRRTFGRSVGSYQAIKHKLADVWTRIEIARGHAYHGAWALARNAQALPLAAAGARVAASEAYEFAAQENLQVHGGIGFTWEADCHPLYKRARSTALALGAPRVWKRHLVERLAQQRSRSPEAVEA